MSVTIRDIGNANNAGITRHQISLVHRSGPRDLPEWKILLLDPRNNRLGFRGLNRRQGKEDLIVPLEPSLDGSLGGTVRLGNGEIFSCYFENGNLPGRATWKRPRGKDREHDDDTEVYVQEDVGDPIPDPPGGGSLGR